MSKTPKPLTTTLSQAIHEFVRDGDSVALPIVLRVLEGYFRRRIKQPENEDEGRGRILYEPIGITAGQNNDG